MNEFSHFLAAPAHPESLFISLEGLDGSGKSTQIEKLKSFFSSKNYSVSCYREPGSTNLGETIRDILLHDKKIQGHSLSNISELLLFASARAQLLEEKILPILAQEKQCVLLDRYIHSTYAYQGFGKKLGTKAVSLIHGLTPLCYLPHYQFYLQLDEQESLQRRQSRSNENSGSTGREIRTDKFENLSDDFFQRVREGLDFFTQKSIPEILRLQVINASGTPDEVFENIIKHFSSP